MEMKVKYVLPGYTPKPNPTVSHLPAISQFGDDRKLPLKSMRPVPTIGKHATAEKHPQLDNPSSWRNPQDLKEHYIPDTEAMLKKMCIWDTI